MASNTTQMLISEQAIVTPYNGIYSSTIIGDKLLILSITWMNFKSILNIKIKTDNFK